MMRVLGTMGILCLIGAGMVSAVCVLGWRGKSYRAKHAVRRSAVDMFRDSTNDYGNLAGLETSPLVRQAEIFASYLNPPPTSSEERPRPVVSPAPAFPSPVAPPQSSPPFTVCGTSYHPVRPHESMALVRIRGNQSDELRWVREDVQIGHFVVDEIRPGAVICRVQGSGQTRELRVNHSLTPPSPVQHYVPQVAHLSPIRPTETADSEPNMMTAGVP